MGYDRIVYIRYHFSCGLDRKDACWLSFTPLTRFLIQVSQETTSGFSDISVALHFSNCQMRKHGKTHQGLVVVWWWVPIFSSDQWRISSHHSELVARIGRFWPWHAWLGLLGIIGFRVEDRPPALSSKYPQPVSKSIKVARTQNSQSELGCVEACLRTCFYRLIP